MLERVLQPGTSGIPAAGDGGGSATLTVVGSVVALWRYPLKSAQGEQLGSVVVDPDGLRGDRVWACLDPIDGSVGSAKHPQRWGRLLQVQATSLDDVTVSADGRAAAAGSTQAQTLLSQHLGRPMRLTKVVPAQARLHRRLPEDPGLVPEWVHGATAGQELLTEVAGAQPGGRFLDYGAVHLISSGALARLGEVLGRTVPASRFRPNIVLDTPADPEPGQELRIGDVVLRVQLPTPRCVVPGLELDGGPVVDQPLLRLLARHHRVPVGDLGRAACFGVYAEVLQPGHVELCQPVR